MKFNSLRQDTMDKHIKRKIIFLILGIIVTNLIYLCLIFTMRFFKLAANGCEHEQCGFGANQLSLTTNLVGLTHFHNQKTSIAYACCYRLGGA